MNPINSLRILFAASEAEPFGKVGGLGDVAGSLPSALRNLSSKDRDEVGEIDIRLVIPYHNAIDGEAFGLRPVASFDISHRDGPISAQAYDCEVNDIPVYLIAGLPIISGAPVYTGDPVLDGYKYTFFSMACLELAKVLGWHPHILHANDWHTAPAVYALNLHQSVDPFYRETATLLTVHNLPYLGVGTGPQLTAFGLPPAVHSPLPWWAQDMPLPLGLLAADHITAVSPTYAREILTPEFGSGLSEFLQSRRSSLSGILNGIDVNRWDPATDPLIEQEFNLRTLTNRAANKEVLQKEMGLEPNPDTLLLGFIGRMDNQKGLDLAFEALRQVTDLPWQIVLLGTGTPELEASAVRLERDLPERVRSVILYNPSLSRRIYAGADALLIPSRYEPCGLVQMIAMRYGCVPIAHATGGLKDTIQDYEHSEQGTGFLFEEATPAALASAIRRAIKVYQGSHEMWEELERNGMRQDFSWERSAREYYSLYQSLVKKGGNNED